MSATLPPPRTPRTNVPALQRRYRSVPRRLQQRFSVAVRRSAKGKPRVWTSLRRFLWSWWPWAVGGLLLAVDDRWGAASAAGIVAFLCHLTAPREFSPTYGLDHEFTTDSEEFLCSVEGATGVRFIDGNHLDIYNNGDEFYPVMLDAIRTARSSITIEAYIYWAGEIGRTFAEALAEKAREGITVKILLDAIGSSSIGEEILEKLDGGGCQIAWFNRIHWYTLSRFNNRTHRKSLIIDGRVAFTGGAGIADHWQGNAQDPDHWRDTQIRIEGPGVTPLQTGFAQNWLRTTGELVSGYEFYPSLDSAGNLSLQTVLSSPETGASSVRIMYYLSIVCARRFIYIANPYFVPDQMAIDILIAAKNRGVDIKVMVAGRHNDSRLARCNSTRLYGELLKCGIEIYEYNRTMLHHKVMVVDGLWATVGTTNFDNRSFAHNAENNVCFCDREAVNKMGATFLEDLGGCDQVSLEAWHRRGMWTKTQEAVLSLLQDQV